MFKKIIKLSLTILLCTESVLHADDTIVEFFEETGRVIVRSSEPPIKIKKSKPTASLTINGNEELPLLGAFLEKYAKGIKTVKFKNSLPHVDSDVPEYLVNALSTLPALEEVNLAGIFIDDAEWKGIKDIPVISKLSFLKELPWQWPEHLKEGKWQKVTLPSLTDNIAVMTSKMTPAFIAFLSKALPRLTCAQKKSERMLPWLAEWKPLGQEAIAWDDGLYSTTYVPAEEICLWWSGIVTESCPLQRIITGELIFDGGNTSHEYVFNYTSPEGESFNWLQAFLQSEFPDVSVTVTSTEITLDKRPMLVAVAAEDAGN
ncbi:MAG: hypothetical protein JSR85_05675 [Proteobacteria bacterium]|nr:hypothetical protein [Pseudomonadota bacterium]